MTGYRTGDLVELRADAERGIVRIFEVMEVRSGGGLRLRQRDAHNLVVIAIEPGDVAELVLLARAEVLHLIRQGV